MKWIDGTEFGIKGLSGEEICEKLADELWNYDRSHWLECDEFIQVAAFLIDFDTELQMEGIFGFLVNSIVNYATNVIEAFKAIGDEKDAEILSEICYLNGNCELSEEIESEIEQLENQLYLNREFDIWQLLFEYLDSALICEDKNE